MRLIKLTILRIRSQHAFLVDHGKDLERMEGFREVFIRRELKDSERLELRKVPNEEFLHEKITTETFMKIMVLQKISKKINAV